MKGVYVSSSPVLLEIAGTLHPLQCSNPCNGIGIGLQLSSFSVNAVMQNIRKLSAFLLTVSYSWFDLVTIDVCSLIPQKGAHLWYLL